jgi:uncharacterized repeat protein (TIGR03803 family)
MHSKGTWRVGRAARAIVVFTVICAASLWSQTYHVIFNFDSAIVGSNPYAPLTFDNRGNLYGTAFVWHNQDPNNCTSGCGTVFRLSPNGSGGWNGTVLHVFAGSEYGEGGSPNAPVIFDRLGNLYGSSNCSFECAGLSGGSIFKLTPVPQGPWTESILYRYGFFGICEPLVGFANCSIAFDSNGQLYGSTVGGDSCPNPDGGGVFLLRPAPISHWLQSNLYCFMGGTDGQFPQGLLAFDASNNVYGTTSHGGSANLGTTYQLRPNHGSQGWTRTILHSFQGGDTDGSTPMSAVVVDASGNVYGTTTQGGPSGQGTVYMLTPHSDGTWTEAVLYAFRGGNDAAFPTSALTFDASGNLYGTAVEGGTHRQGAIFKLMPAGGGHWTENVVYNFTGGQDGAFPYGGVIIDASGTLYGTASIGGPTDDGVAFTLQP